MEDIEREDYKKRVLDKLKSFEDTYGSKADLVNVNSQTVGTKIYNQMKTILDEENIAVEIDDRVIVGKFMFLNRELVISNLL